MRLMSVQVGRPRTEGVRGAADPMERAFTSAIWKRPVAGPVAVAALGLDGDAVADRRHHGGLDQAVLMYAAAHYPLWRAEWGRELVFGDFGENLTVDGLTEDEACIGDVYDVGEVRLEVTQPREPCGTLARRHQVPDLVAVVRTNARSGWYLRILQEGRLAAGQPVTLVSRPNPGWTIRRAGLAMLERHRRPDEALDLAAVTGLSRKWRERLLALRS